MTNNLLLPLKIWQACRFIPIVFFAAQIALVWLLDSLISPILLSELNRGISEGSIPAWAAHNLHLTIIIIPWFAYFPFVFSIAGYPSRLAFLKSEGITLKENFVLWWLTLGKSLSCYGFIWRVLPWYLLPIIAILLTRELLPTFIPTRYKTLSDSLLLLFALVAAFKALPVLLAPLTAAIGMYPPYHALQTSRAVFTIEKWKVLGLSILFCSFYYLLLQDPKLVYEYIRTLPIVAMILIFLFLNILSAIFVKTIAQLESNNTR